MADLRKAAAVVAGAVLAMSPLALLDMKKHEGAGPTFKTAEGVRYKAYPDPYLGWGKATICYGHTKGEAGHDGYPSPVRSVVQGRRGEPLCSHQALA